MAASNPPLIPTPICPCGIKVSGIKGRIEEQQSLPTRRQIISPTAIRQKPPV